MPKAKADEVEEISGKKWFDLPEGNEVFFICKCHYAFAIIFRNGKQILKYISNALAQRRAKVLENQMRILLGNCRIFVGSNIVSKRNIIESKVDRWTMGKMGYDQSIRCATMFVYYDKVGDIVGPTSFCKFLYNIISSIDAMRIRENKSQLLGHYDWNVIIQVRKKKPLPWKIAVVSCLDLEKSL